MIQQCDVSQTATNFISEKYSMTDKEKPIVISSLITMKTSTTHYKLTKAGYKTIHNGLDFLDIHARS